MSEELRDLLSRIEALATNPHWTNDRRWRIGELAREAKVVLEKEEDKVCASCGDPNRRPL